MAATLSERGYRVQLNHPYRGEELIRRHGKPSQRRYSVQIELNRALYMDEPRFQRHAGCAQLVADLGVCVGRWQREFALMQQTGPAPPD
jgi:N-formylglutamate deformylase